MIGKFYEQPDLFIGQTSSRIVLSMFHAIQQPSTDTIEEQKADMIVITKKKRISKAFNKPFYTSV